MSLVTRFAPSPTGFLHLGHAFSALTAFDAAQAAGGVFLLRIEDLDQGRCRPAFETAIFEDLAWLGLSWSLPVTRQSEHLARYASALKRFAELGLVYRCFKSRRSLSAEAANAPHGPGEAFTGAPLPEAEECARLAEGQAFAWRLSIAACQAFLGPRWERLSFEADGTRVTAKPGVLGDAILGRKDFPASYHLASVMDDAAQGVTDVIRGEDLREAAHLHALLHALLELPSPRYRHHRLILGPDGRRLAKRDQAGTLRALRDAGATPEGLRRLLGL
jgi:glutamyl-Q tRNA(Asp) synthetase